MLNATVVNAAGESYQWFTSHLSNLAKVTPQDVQRVAQKYFQPANRVIGIYTPNGRRGK